MRSKALMILLAACVALAWGVSAFGVDAPPAPPGWASSYYKNGAEPPDPSFNYYDGTPTDYRYFHSCEIFDMSLWQQKNTSGKLQNNFYLQIWTNFGNLADRSDGTDPNEIMPGAVGDSYNHPRNYGTMLEEVLPGDLFIRVRNKPNVPSQPMDNATVAVYGLPLESRSGSTAYWFDQMNYIYGVNPLAPITVGTTSTLYKDVKFATGTYEGYETAVAEIPPMVWADAIPSQFFVPSVRSIPDENRYPTILLEGSATSTSIGVNWNPADFTYSYVKGSTTYSYTVDGMWEIGGANGFSIPGFDPEKQYVEFWWSMVCGNDGSVIWNHDGSYSSFDPIPLPSSLLLCGIGVGFAGLVRAVRRFRRS